jgi:hypothetical protein
MNEFKIGDWVRIKNLDGLARANEVGIIAKLDYHIYHDYYKVIFNTVDDDGDYWNNFEDNDLELIERPKLSFADMIK